MENVEDKVKRAAKGLTYMLQTFAKDDIKVELYDYHIFDHHYSQTVTKAKTISMNIEFTVDDPGPELHNVSEVLSEIANLNFGVCKNYEIDKNFMLTKRKEDFFESDDVLGIVYKINMDVRTLKVILTNEFDVFPDAEN